MPSFMNVAEVARYLRVSEKTVYRLLEHGVLPAVKVDEQWRFDKNSIDRWLRSSSSLPSKVLIIDDEESVRDVLKEIMQEIGYSAVCSASAKEALEMLHNERFDLIFLDLKMPLMDGAELFREIRAVSPDMSVVVTTGYPDSDLMVKALSYGPLGVLNKPFNKLDVVKVVHGYLD